MCRRVYEAIGKGEVQAVVLEEVACEERGRKGSSPSRTAVHSSVVRNTVVTRTIYSYRLSDLLAIGRVVPRYGERLIRKRKEVRNQTYE